MGDELLRETCCDPRLQEEDPTYCDIFFTVRPINDCREYDEPDVGEIF